MSHSKICFMMSGSIAAFKACEVLSALCKEGHEVQVIATSATFEFVGKATLEGLTGRKVLSDLWQEGEAMNHISLSRWADFGLLCPASAHTLAKLAHGFAEDLLSSLVLAWPTQKPLWIFPAMNHAMYSAPPTQANLQALRARGFNVSETASGALACGEEGPGRMLEAAEILARLHATPLGRVLVTGGATREPIDGIRFISNVSTGQTAAALCDHLTTQGWEVTFLGGQGCVQPRRAHRRLAYRTFDDLHATLQQELQTQDYHGVIHLSAVGDYSVVNARLSEKLPSGEDITLKLRPNIKLLPQLKEYARNKAIRVVGFKLTLDQDPIPAATLALNAGAVDAVVANRWNEVEPDRSRHPSQLVREGQAPLPFETLDQLAHALHLLLQGELK